MFKHILVLVDGFATAFSAVDNAQALAKAFGSEVTTVYVIDLYSFTGVGADFAYGQDQYLTAATAEANAAVDAVATRLEEAGVKVHKRVVEANSASRGILEAAQAMSADLIVMLLSTVLIAAVFLHRRLRKSLSAYRKIGRAHV